MTCGSIVNGQRCAGVANPVSGPSSGTSTDNAIARWDGATGDLLQDSSVILEDTGHMLGVRSVEAPVAAAVGDGQTLLLGASDGGATSGDGGNLDLYPGDAPGGSGVPGAIRILGQIARANILTPANFVGPVTIQNWSEAGMVAANVWRFNPTGGTVQIGGIVSSDVEPWTEKLIRNLSSTIQMDFLNEAAGSTAANRIHAPNAATFILRPQMICWLFYDPTSQRWCING